jgi:hypothetical protein
MASAWERMWSAEDTADFIEGILEVYEAWNRGDIDAATDVPDDFVFDLHAKVPGLPEVVRGPEEYRKFFHDWYVEAWDGNLHQTVERIWLLDDARYMSNVTFQGTGRSSGIQVPDLHYTHIWDGEKNRLDGYIGWRKALVHAGFDPENPPKPDWERPGATPLSE